MMSSYGTQLGDTLFLTSIWCNLEGAWGVHHVQSVIGKHVSWAPISTTTAYLQLFWQPLQKTLVDLVIWEPCQEIKPLRKAFAVSSWALRVRLPFVLASPFLPISIVSSFILLIFLHILHTSFLLPLHHLLPHVSPHCFQKNKTLLPFLLPLCPIPPHIFNSHFTKLWWVKEDHAIWEWSTVNILILTVLWQCLPRDRNPLVVCEWPYVTLWAEEVISQSETHYMWQSHRPSATPSSDPTTSPPSSALLATPTSHGPWWSPCVSSYPPHLCHRRCHHHCL